MGALVGKFGTAALGAVVPKGIDPATAAVRVGRVLYVGGIGYIGLLWYWGWRNERIGPDDTSLPIPFLFKGGKIRDGADDAGSPGDVSLAPAAGDDVPRPGPAQDLPHGGPGNQTLPQAGGGLTGNAALLVALGKQVMLPPFKLHVSEHPAFGGVTPVHVKDSMHYKGRAWDASAPATREGLARMDAAAAWLAANYLAQTTMLIWNGPHPVFILNGKRVAASVFAASLASHRTHIHFGI